MNIAQAIGLAVSLSMGGLLLSIALSTGVRDLTYLLRKPSLLLRSVLAMNIVMPLYAVTMALVFDLDRALEVTLIAMALGPVPPILPGRQLKAGGTRAYTMGLLMVSAAISIVFVPAAADLLGRVFDKPLHVAPAAVAGIVATWMLLPLVVGALVHSAAPVFSQRLARPLAIASNGLLVVALVPILVKMWPQIWLLIGNFTVVAIIAFVLVGLLVGHLLGGPDENERTVLALSTATRHPAVAMAILHGDDDPQQLFAAVLLVLVVGMVASGPYVKWRTRHHAAQLAGSTRA